jgi:HNH endonuclease
LGASPVIPRNIPEIEEALILLGMTPDDVRCAFCGNKSTEWDHLRALVVKQRPTGFISEIANLVPACAKCNQSKGNKPWRLWIVGAATHSPTKRAIADVAARIARLEAYENWREPTKFDFEAFLGAEAWAEYWALWTNLNEEMSRCQAIADGLRRQIAERLLQQQSNSE